VHFCVVVPCNFPSRSPFRHNMSSVVLSAEGVADVQRLRHRLASAQEEVASLNDALFVQSAAHKDLSLKLLALEQERDVAVAQASAAQLELAALRQMVSSSADAQTKSDEAETALRALRAELAALHEAKEEPSHEAALSAKATLTGVAHASADVAAQASGLQPLSGVLDDASALVEALSGELVALRSEVAAQRSRGDELAALAEERGRQLARLRGGDAGAGGGGALHPQWRSSLVDSLEAVESDDAQRSLASAAAEAKRAAQKLSSGLAVLVATAGQCAREVETAASLVGHVQAGAMSTARTR
jgi:chromosome segregation ATPase